MIGTTYGTDDDDDTTRYTEISVRDGSLVMTRRGQISALPVSAGSTSVTVGCHRLSWESFDMLVDRIQSARAQMPGRGVSTDVAGDPLVRIAARVDGWIDRLTQAVERAERVAHGAGEDEQP
jgi:hypothetical protein